MLFLVVIQCKDNSFESPQTFPMQTISDTDGGTINVDSMVDFWMGEWTKEYFVSVQLPHQKPKMIPHKGFVVVWEAQLQKIVQHTWEKEKKCMGKSC